MALIPRYWYVEPCADGLPFQCLPQVFGDLIPSPTAGDDQIILDPETGEIYGHAILMSALPWPRFRAFSTGKEMVLPHRCAVALERVEYEPANVSCHHCGHRLSERTHHYRVEHLEGERYAVSRFCHWAFSLNRRDASPACHPRLPHRRGVEGPRQPKMGQGPRLQVYGEAKPPIRAYKQPEGRVLEYICTTDTDLDR